MSSIPAAADVLDPSVRVLPLPDVAERLHQPITRVHQALRDHHLLAVRRKGVLMVPADFLDEETGAVVKGLPGTITVLNDSGFSPEEMIRWLFTADDSLPGTPIDALRGNRGREVKRRAQALAL
ncbi:Rv2175c family DNA-binding protein [Actinokineospora sp.]|uniref:Rv2175c family DNA-binding protein n=1 Tax=Actinokineospora sp. TaxID=1872133 RepID=UPI00403778D0